MVEVAAGTAEVDGAGMVEEAGAGTGAAGAGDRASPSDLAYHPSTMLLRQRTYYPPPAYYPYPPYYGYGGYPYPPGYAYGYASRPQPSYVNPGTDPNNCGTPDEPKPCPRRPG